MSTFRGRISEFPGIAVDKFHNLSDVHTFFLSHAHADHTDGLEHYSQSATIWCSELTRTIILQDPRYQRLDLTLKPLQPMVPMQLERNQKISVTLLDANHCPGSSMFLFETISDNGQETCILYTGDFRLELDKPSEEEKAVVQFLSSRTIDHVYLDTTFAQPEYRYFPSRVDGCRLLIDEVNRLEKHHSDNMSYWFKCSMYGYERILRDIAQTFDTKIHLDGDLLKVYQKLDGMEDIITDDPLSTRFHACTVGKRISKTNATIPCSRSSAYAPKLYTTFTFGSTWYKTIQPGDDHIYKQDYYCKIPFAIHASFGELRAFIGAIRPLKITACVVAKDKSSADITHQFADLLRAPKSNSHIFSTSDRPPPNSGAFPGSNQSSLKLRHNRRSRGFSVTLKRNNSENQPRCPPPNTDQHLLFDSPRQRECILWSSPTTPTTNTNNNILSHSTVQSHESAVSDSMASTRSAVSMQPPFRDKTPDRDTALTNTAAFTPTRSRKPQTIVLLAKSTPGKTKPLGMYILDKWREHSEKAPIAKLNK